jgi:hypothetical protein
VIESAREISRVACRLDEPAEAASLRQTVHGLQLKSEKKLHEVPILLRR